MTEQMQAWSQNFARKMQELFPSRVAFVGIQGSHRRGEATAHSDIEMVVILDELRMEDLKKYRDFVMTMEEREAMCGFVSGKNELANWPRGDLFQFYHDTEAIEGDLLSIISLPTREDAAQALQAGAANLYHAACHCYLFEQGKAQTLAALYKGVLFLLQAWLFAEREIYCSNAQALGEELLGEEAALFQGWQERGAIAQESGAALEQRFSRLISWCAKKVVR